MGAVIFSLPAALIGAVYYSMTFGLGPLEAFSLYVLLGLGTMASTIFVSTAVSRVSRIVRSTK